MLSIWICYSRNETLLDVTPVRIKMSRRDRKYSFKYFYTYCSWLGATYYHVWTSAFQSVHSVHQMVLNLVPIHDIFLKKPTLVKIVDDHSNKQARSPHWYRQRPHMVHPLHGSSIQSWTLWADEMLSSRETSSTGGGWSGVTRSNHWAPPPLPSMGSSGPTQHSHGTHPHCVGQLRDQ